MKGLCGRLLGCVVLGACALDFYAGGSALAQEKTVYSFCSQTNCADGETPAADLVEVNGTLYGTTELGGDTGCGGYGCGTVFSLDPGTGAETVLYSFCSQTNCTDGATPRAGLISVNGKLYGTTTGGGSTGCISYACGGTVFALDPGTGAETVLHSFTGGADGAEPSAGLVAVNGILYGTTYFHGGSGCDGYGCGTAFSLDPGTGIETVLHTFCSGGNCADGAEPTASLIEEHGKLYGTTLRGGTGCVQGVCGQGTVFSLDPATRKEKVVHSFCSQTNCTDGQDPDSGLIDVEGTLYGTTSAGGKSCGEPYCGIVFSLDPQTGTETVLYAFCQLTECSDGSEPVAGLIAEKGVLYGTTENGGAYNGGTVFSLDPSTRTETVLYSFCRHGVHCKDGQSPLAGLLRVQGRLYGTTFTGGARTGECLWTTCGALFWVKP